jgi:hypothetical protein
MRVLVLSIMAVLSMTCPLRAAFLTPSHYLAFDDSAAGSSISPFAGLSFQYFHLENFEDGLLNTPGVLGVGGSVIGPGGLTDSVDKDDGTINGSGSGGRSYFSINGAGGVAFVFNPTLLSPLPDHVGIVWTDGANTAVTFTAFDSSGVSLGSSTATPGTGGNNGQT